MTRLARFEPGLFAAVNKFFEPLAQAGLLSSAVWPVGVISLETKGRRSGRPHRVPVLAVHCGEHVLVATARADRSDWFRNVEANPEVQYWLAGSAFEASALVLGADGAAHEALPESVARAVTAASAAGRLAGWRFAVLMPR